MASDIDADAGFGIGDVVVVEPGGYEIEVVGLARDAQLQVSATVFVTYDTYPGAVSARNPDASDRSPNALGVAPAEGGSADETGHGHGGSAMKLALRELRRRPGRFVAATAI